MSVHCFCCDSYCLRAICFPPRWFLLGCPQRTFLSTGSFGSKQSTRSYSCVSHCFCWKKDSCSRYITSQRSFSWHYGSNWPCWHWNRFRWWSNFSSFNPVLHLSTISEARHKRCLYTPLSLSPQGFRQTSKIVPSSVDLWLNHNLHMPFCRLTLLDNYYFSSWSLWTTLQSGC